MRRFSSVVLAIAAGLLDLVATHEPFCASACLTITTDFVYDNCSPLDDLYYACRCTNPTFLGNMAVCIDQYCKGEGWNWLDSDICQGYGETGPIISYETVLANATKYVTESPKNLTLALMNPVYFPEVGFPHAYDTVADFDGNMEDASFFGYLFRPNAL